MAADLTKCQCRCGTCLDSDCEGHICRPHESQIILAMEVGDLDYAPARAIIQALYANGYLT